MPVLRERPQDPTDLVIAGELMRSVAVTLPVDPTWPLTEDLESYAPMNASDPVDSVSSWVPEFALPRANAGVATPCGAFIPRDVGSTLMLRQFVQSSQQWRIVGVTYDSADVALAACRVLAFDIGQLMVGGPALVAETVSDGSGNFTLVVPLNTNYWLAAYKPGSPDAGGVTTVTQTPEAF